MRQWSILFLGVMVLTGCPLEPLRVAGFAPGVGMRQASLSTSQVAVRVPGLSGQDAAGLQAMINGVPVPIVSTADGEVVLRMPPGYNGGEAVFELWRHGERIASRDIAAQLSSGIGVSHASPTGQTLASGMGGGTDRSSLMGDINITITLPNGSGAAVVSDGTGNNGNNGNASPSPTPSPSPSPSPTPTPNPDPTPTPSATLVPVADQTPVPGGTGEVSGDVSF